VLNNDVFRSAIVRHPRPSESSSEGTLGRVVGIVRKFGRKPVTGIIGSDADGESLSTLEEAMSDTSSDIVPYLEYHIEFGYTFADLPLISSPAADVCGWGSERTKAWVIGDVLRWVMLFAVFPVSS
jgi:hypothetical protein